MNLQILWRGWTLRHSSTFLAVCIAAIITACEKNPPPKTNQPAVTHTFPGGTVLQGTLTDRNGLLKISHISAHDQQNNEFATTDVSNGHYQLALPDGVPLPLILEAKTPNGTTWRVVAIDPSQNRYDISPLTTAIADKAQTLGGYTRNNLVIAAESMVHVPDANKTSTGFRGDPTTQYGGWH